MVTLGEIVRWFVYRLSAFYNRFATRVMRRDRLVAGSERKFRALLEAAPDAMVIIDRHAHIALVNAQAERLFGYARGEIVGQNINELIPQRYRSPHREHVKQYLRAGVPRPMGAGRELFALRKDGSEFPVEISLSPLDTTSGRLVSAGIRDITERKRAVEDLAQAEARFRGAFEKAPIGMALLGLDGRLEEVNASLGEITGYSPDALEHTSLESITHPDDLATGREALSALLAGERDIHQAELRLLHASGRPVWVSLQITLIGESPDGVRNLLAQVQDITSRRDFEQRLRYLADHDVLTGLLNRRSFNNELDSQAARVERYGPDGAVLVIDLDHFKYVNDMLGHHAGDEVIAAIAQSLSERLRDSDRLARLGGDEFAVLLPRGTTESARRVAEDVLETVRETRVTIPRFGERRVTASIGVAVFDGTQGLTGEDALVNADLAMYDAKESGRDRYALFNTDDHSQARMKGRVTWAERIREALEEDRFTLVAQPIIELSSGHVPQHELLLRMSDVHGDLIPPGAFLYIAERLDLIRQIDTWVVQRAIEMLAEDRVPGALEVNLSGRSVGEPALLELIAGELKRTGVAPSRLIFEITETAAIDNLLKARRFSHHLAELGCRFALDDFGAGFGSFYYLKNLTFDYLKIDGEFVRECRSNKTDRLIISAVVDIARGLGKETIAEFVGDDDTARLLAELGVDYGQGFHLGRPEPLAAMFAPRPPALPSPSAPAQAPPPL